MVQNVEIVEIQSSVLPFPVLLLLSYNTSNESRISISIFVLVVLVLNLILFYHIQLAYGDFTTTLLSSTATLHDGYELFSKKSNNNNKLTFPRFNGN